KTFLFQGTGPPRGSQHALGGRGLATIITAVVVHVARDQIGIDVEELPAGPRRGEPARARSRALEELEGRRIHGLHIAHPAEVDLGPAGRAWHSTRGADEPAITAAQPHRAPAVSADGPHDLLVDASGQNHLDDRHRLVVRDPQYNQL